jgi:FAD/FMN-containing dehydrogenase
MFPMPKAFSAAFVAVASPARAVELLSHLRARVGERVTGFELISRECVDLAVKNLPGVRDPLAGRYPWYVLVELSDSTDAEALGGLLETALGDALEEGIADDAMVCASEQQRLELWKLREELTEAQKPDRITVKHDIAVPVSRVPEFIERAGAALIARFPDIRIIAFGHVGDGNIHYNTSNPDAAAHPAQSPEVNTIVYDVVHALDGSISAEHGLGQLKRDEIAHYKDALELDLMRAIKKAFDPRGLMNPGKVLPESRAGKQDDVS